MVGNAVWLQSHNFDMIIEFEIYSTNIGELKLFLKEY